MEKNNNMEIFQDRQLPISLKKKKKKKKKKKEQVMGQCVLSTVTYGC